MAAVAVVCRALAVAAALLSWEAARAAAEPPVDAAVGKARALIAGGDPEAALTILRALPPDDRHTEILFQTGLAAMAAAEREGLPEDAREARLDEAVAALRTILIDRPDLVRVRLELARAFFLKREDSLARRHFERVLAGELPPAVVANVNRFLALMRARRRWSAWFAAAVTPDSNVNGASDTEIVYIDTAFGRLPFRRDPESLARSGVSFSAWGGGEYQHPLGERLRLRAGADTGWQNSGGDATHTFVTGHLGPRWLAAPDTEFSLLATASRGWRSAGYPDDTALGVRLEADHRLSGRLRLHGAADWRRRDYRDGGGLDGPATDLALSAFWGATPILHTHATLGYTHERPRMKSRRNAGFRGRLGASLALPLGFTVGVSGEMRWADYEGSGRAHMTSDGAGREDRTRILRATILNRGFTLMGFSPQLALINENRTTNAQALDYQRYRLESRLVRQF